MIDDLIEVLCDEAEQYGIRLNIEDRKGAINIRKKEMFINPVYWEERAETFTHEMLHHYHDQIRCDNLGYSEEKIIEMETQSLLKNKQNRDYVIKYLRDRGL